MRKVQNGYKSQDESHQKFRCPRLILDWTGAVGPQSSSKFILLLKGV